MRICNIQDNDICLNCHFTPQSEHGDVCRYAAEYWLVAYEQLLHTNLTDGQKDILRKYKMLSE